MSLPHARGDANASVMRVVRVGTPVCRAGLHPAFEIVTICAMRRCDGRRTCAVGRGAGSGGVERRSAVPGFLLPGLAVALLGLLILARRGGVITGLLRRRARATRTLARRWLTACGLATSR